MPISCVEDAVRTGWPKQLSELAGTLPAVARSPSSTTSTPPGLSTAIISRRPAAGSTRCNNRKRQYTRSSEFRGKTVAVALPCRKLGLVTPACEHRMRPCSSWDALDRCQ
jgi:hypothetical protein